ncbi:MAG TPA: dehydrogenase [Micromonosporaceae bacterium]|nr:dehydrogenase [Micromonosporaceae bacterium]HCU51886.1 dehydrogenase [Micromonosporaceae bacterium]
MSVALVTGGNRGIGRETVRQLADRGLTVLLGSRDLARGITAARELTADAEIIPISFDVTDVACVEAAAARIAREYGGLDVLVNNAGTIAGAPAVATAVNHLRRTFEVNVFGVVTAIHTLLPLLSKSTAPRIVNVSSTTASMTLTSERADLPGDASQRLAYCSSKAALNMLTVQYALAFGLDPDLRHIKINSASPGYTATDMNDHRGFRHVSEGARIIVDLATLPDSGPTGGFFSDSGAIPW